jgi:hypothetical protein
VEVGRAAQIKISRSYYEFDGQEFQGDVFLDKNLVQHQMGAITFRVAGIRDAKYGLTVYKSNEVTVIFDKLSTILDIQTLPFLTIIHVKVFYQYDGAPVTRSEVLAMGVKLSQDPKSAGLYTASFIEFSPYISGKVLVNTEGFETLRLDYSRPHIGNVLSYSAVSAAALLLFFVKRKKTKTYKPRTKV